MSTHRDAVPDWRGGEKRPPLAAGDLFDGRDERLLHRALEREPRLTDRFDLAAVEQRALDRRVEVLEEADDVVVAHERARDLGAATVALAMHLRHRVRD